MTAGRREVVGGFRLMEKGEWRRGQRLEVTLFARQNKDVKCGGKKSKPVEVSYLEKQNKQRGGCYEDLSQYLLYCKSFQRLGHPPSSWYKEGDILIHVNVF